MELNNIYQMDCIKGMQEMIEKGITVDCILSDPPYKITSRGTSGTTGGMLVTELSKKGKIFEHNDIKIEDYIELLYGVLKESGHCYLMTNNKNLTHFLKVVEKSSFQLCKVLIWKKNAPISNPYYMDTHEYILFLRKGKAKKINNCGTKSVFEVSNVKKRLHPCEKPIELLKIMINNSTNEGDTLFDPFIGSGSLPIACIETNRNYIGFELDEHYYKIATKRIEEQKGEA